MQALDVTYLLHLHKIFYFMRRLAARCKTSKFGLAELRACWRLLGFINRKADSNTGADNLSGDD